MALIGENRDASFWNRVANDADVRPWIGPGDQLLDLTELLADPGVLALATEWGGFLLTPVDGSRLELHTLFLREGRGASVVPAFRQMARHVFTATDALEIVTKVAASNRAASLMARRVGFRPLFVRAGAWFDGSDLAHYVMTLDEWMQADAALQEEGHAFHELLERAKKAAGSELVTHPDDAAHDKAAGAAALMAKAGKPAKAAWIYSRWAAFAGYQTIELIESEPPVIDVRDAIVTVRDGRLEVMECR